MKRLLLTSLAVVCCLIAYSQNSNGLMTRTVVYKPGDYNSLFYRIPAIITAKDGSLVITSDKRKFNNNDLPADIDVVCNYSTDNGLTWSQPYTIAQGKGVGAGFGDAGLARSLDENGLITVFVGGQGFFQSTAENPIRTYKCMSYDNGRTWTEPEDITHFIFGKDCDDPERKHWQGSFCASGNGLLTSKGRIIFVAAVRETTINGIWNHAVYSDDNGKTWHVSGRATQGIGDESKIVELNDGSLLMSIRTQGKRLFSLSYDGGETWLDSPQKWHELNTTACNGDLIRYTLKRDGYEHDILLQSLPDNYTRSDVTVFVSFDEGKTWPIKKIVVPYASAYSSLCILPDNTIGLYVEERDNCTVDESYQIGYEMVFYRFTFDWLME